MRISTELRNILGFELWVIRCELLRGNLLLIRNGSIWNHLQELAIVESLILSLSPSSHWGSAEFEYFFIFKFVLEYTFYNVVLVFICTAKWISLKDVHIPPLFWIKVICSCMFNTIQKRCIRLLRNQHRCEIVKNIQIKYFSLLWLYERSSHGE